MSARIYDLIIVGAGITGLNLGLELRLLDPNLDILIIEKSKGSGGRMATRRVGENRFDHGAQFVREVDISKKLIQFWNENKAIKDFSFSKRKSFCGSNGMTSPAKKIAELFTISYNTKLLKIKKFSHCFEILCEDNRTLFAKQVVLTSPLPQSLDILTASDIEFEPSLKALSYSMAIVLLAEFDSELKLESHYLESAQDNIFSICSQSAKSLSQRHCYTICMSAPWSDQKFSLKDEEIFKASKLFLEKKFPSNQVQNLEVKKWKFSKPTETWQNSFYSPQPGITLAGDAFGGPSISGALKSSYAVFDSLKNALNVRGTFS